MILFEGSLYFASILFLCYMCTSVTVISRARVKISVTPLVLQRALQCIILFFGSALPCGSAFAMNKLGK